MRRTIGLLMVVALAVSAALLGGCVQEQKLAPPAQAVQELLELRSENSTDTAGYTRYVEETAVADALAQDAATRDKGSPIPEWKTPTVESSTEASAAVLVVWVPSAEFKDWPKSTTFVLKKLDGRWVVADASEAEADEAESDGVGSETQTPEP